MKYATPIQYSKLCGISPQAVYDRIAKGTLETLEKEDFTGQLKQVIDLKKYPPARLKFSGKKFKEKE
jgi:hypothetical protein